MELDGTLEKNLVAAIGSAKRLRTRSVHADTIAHWTYVLELAEVNLLCNARESLSFAPSALAFEISFKLRSKLVHRHTVPWVVP